MYDCIIWDGKATSPEKSGNRQIFTKVHISLLPYSGGSTPTNGNRKPIEALIQVS